ncbi:hypothetical protein [Sphingomicrobium aestuariivivum]|uniref:hypothetical protein n=1 Tax=Sphingomicrobium aestuariivivum TaxID=1582356 RepID=UPI001FD71528|nr:hypothetical protein [Sphingomicrobium aestuariivivum]MCJ8191389.1 hypothetical protein [Sphingomicrobium aestuariivivum]
MIVLWRKVRSAVGGIGPTEWALLAIEGVIVFLSIFAAFQLSEFAENRRDAARLGRIEAQLLEEARTALGLIWRRTSQREEELPLARSAARDLAAGRCPDDAAFQSLWSVQLYEMIDPPSGVYDELVNSVGVSALSADARLAVDFYRNSLNYVKGQLPNFRSQEEFLRPEDPRLAVHASGSDEGRGMRMVFDREAYCADREFADAVNFAVRNQAVFQRYRNDLLDDAAFLCVVLAEEQGRKCTGEWVEQLIPDDARADIERRGRARWEAADL